MVNSMEDENKILKYILDESFISATKDDNGGIIIKMKPKKTSENEICDIWGTILDSDVKFYYTHFI